MNHQRTLQKPDAALADLTQFFRLGIKVNQAGTADGRYSPGVIQDLTTKTKHSAARLFKARQFARLYDEKDFEELCSLRTADGDSLGIGHILELILIPSRPRRKRLQQLAVKKNWSVRELRAERMRQFGVNEERRNAGRLPRLPKSKEEALRQLEQRASAVLRWISALTPNDEIQATSKDSDVKIRKSAAAKKGSDTKPLQVSLEDLPNPVQEALAAVDRKLKALEQALRSHLA